MDIRTLKGHFLALLSGNAGPALGPGDHFPQNPGMALERLLSVLLLAWVFL